MRALELACGTGGSTAIHYRHVSDLVSMDFSLKMVRGAAHHRDWKLVHFLVADASDLPFRDGIFHAVFSRGVLLSYVPDPMRMLREARRVLRRGGKLALDAMNQIQGSSRTRTRLFCMMGERPAYVEHAVQAGLQVRWIHWLDRRSPFVKLARKEEKPESRPRNLAKHVTSVERFEGRLFRPQNSSAWSNRLDSGRLMSSRWVIWRTHWGLRTNVCGSLRGVAGGISPDCICS